MHGTGRCREKHDRQQMFPNRNSSRKRKGRVAAPVPDVAIDSEYGVMLVARRWPYAPQMQRTYNTKGGDPQWREVMIMNPTSHGASCRMQQRERASAVPVVTARAAPAAVVERAGRRGRANGGGGRGHDGAVCGRRRGRFAVAAAALLADGRGDLLAQVRGHGICGSHCWLRLVLLKTNI